MCRPSAKVREPGSIGRRVGGARRQFCSSRRFSRRRHPPGPPVPWRDSPNRRRAAPCAPPPPCASAKCRRGAQKKLNPKADPKGDLDEASNWDNFTRWTPARPTCSWTSKGPGVITHIWITFLGPEPQEWAPKGSANHQEMLLRMYWDGSKRPAVEAPLGDFFANCFGQRREVDQHAGGRGQRRCLQLLLADAVSQVGPHRDRQRKRKAHQPALLQHRLDQEGQACPRTRLTSTRSTGRNTPSRTARITCCWKPRARGTTWARCWPCAPAARPGSAKATRRSTSTARASPRFGARARRTISSAPGA